MSTRQLWHYELCPACGITGSLVLSDVRADGMWSIRIETCAVCDGTGRVKIPDGYELTAAPSFVASIRSGTSTTESTTS